MKLSEAIRKGAALRPQAFDDYLDNWHDPHGTDGWRNDAGACTCVIGAAFEGLTGLLPFDDPAYVYGEVTPDPRLDAVVDDPNLGAVCATVLALTGIEEHAKLLMPDMDGRLSPVDCAPVDVLSAIAILNDNLRWSREQIADYIAAQGY